MNTTPQLDTHPVHPKLAGRTRVSDFEYPQSSEVPTERDIATPTKKVLPQLTTFRALNRQVFGAMAVREFVFEAVLFVWMMIVAAWPLGVTLNQLGTMYIAPPNALW
jgi:hypothetical protein